MAGLDEPTCQSLSHVVMCEGRELWEVRCVIGNLQPLFSARYKGIGVLCLDRLSLALAFRLFGIERRVTCNISVCTVSSLSLPLSFTRGVFVLLIVIRSLNMLHI